MSAAELPSKAGSQVPSENRTIGGACPDQEVGNDVKKGLRPQHQGCEDQPHSHFGIRKSGAITGAARKSVGLDVGFEVGNGSDEAVLVLAPLDSGLGTTPKPADAHDARLAPPNTAADAHDARLCGFPNREQAVGSGERPAPGVCAYRQPLHVFSGCHVVGSGECGASLDESGDKGLDVAQGVVRVDSVRFGREYFCRICETESVGADGRCLDCGCQAAVQQCPQTGEHGELCGMRNSFSVDTSSETTFDFKQFSDQHSKNSIPQIRKNRIAQNPKKQDPGGIPRIDAGDEQVQQRLETPVVFHGDAHIVAAQVADNNGGIDCMCLNRAEEERVSSDEDNLLKYSDDLAARGVDNLDCGLVVDRVLLGVKEAEENSEFSGDAHERMLTCDEKAEGGSKLSEEAELCKLERDELDAFVGMSRMREHSVEPEAGRESAEEGNESELKAHPEHEWTDCSQTEGLRLRSEVVQKDIEQFTEWLDERQLRLASLHEDVLQAWVDDTEDHSQVQQIWQDIQDLRYELRSLCLAQLHQDVEDVSATSSAAQETVLQTRIISNAEVMSHWDLWESPTQAELDNLVTDKHALRHSTQVELDQLQKQGFRVVLIPSKAIYSVKAPCGRRKCRLVACGNFLSSSESSKQEHKQVVYTASITIESLRTALAFSTRRKHMLITLDIKAAFLNAVLLPRDRQAAQAAAEKTDQSAAQTSTGNDESQTHEIVALIPPRMLITKGVFKPYDRLIVRKAVYGLDQSPRDWSLQRDQQLKALKIQCSGRTYRLFQSFAEDSIWLVATSEPRRGYTASLHTEVEDSIAGWVAVYVDDLLVGAEALLARAIVAAIMACWDCSSPQEVGDTEESSVRFLGIDLRWDGCGNLLLGQKAYVQELEARYSTELAQYGKPTTPMPPSFDEDVEEEGISITDLRRTQALLGEVLWTSIRTRPDISFVVSKLASRIGKAPVATYKAGLHVLAYLAATRDFVLTYWRENRNVWVNYKRYPDPLGLIEGFGDASFAPEAKRSMQCVQVYAEGAVVAWSVSRQAFMAQSSCEAEMIALMDLANYTISTAYLLDELLQCGSKKQILGDNVAALAIYGGTAAHWRTRHLRIRAKAFAEKYSESLLPAHHVAGEWNPADIGTKSLGAARHWKLCDLVRLRRPSDEIKNFTSSGSKCPALTECLQAVVLACCLCCVQAQPQHADITDYTLCFFMALIMISTVALWEAGRVMIRGLRGFCRARRPLLREPEPESEDESDRERRVEREPDQEDELAEASQQRAQHSMRRQEEEESAGGTGNAATELRRRGARVYLPEPEPVPDNPTAPLFRYADDAAIVGPAEQVEVLRGNGHANPPEPRQNDADRAAPRPRVRVMDYNEVRAEIIRQEADRRLLNFPPEPPIVINPAWGAPPIQPTVRELRQLSTDWGGYASAVFHRPPAGIRNDFYQYDTSRQVLIRWHCRPRLRLFNPDTTRLPAPLEARMLSGRRRTMVQDTRGDRMITDDFRGAAVATTRALEREWWGRTEMQVIPAERLQG